MTPDSAFTIFPTLRTERCTLNHIESSDIANVNALLKDKSVIRYIEAIESPLSFDETTDFISLFHTSYHNRRAILWAIRINSATETSIGLIAIHQVEEKVDAELLYLLAPQYWKQGYMKECLMRVTQFCFDDLELQVVRLSINKQNTDSIVLAQRCGYRIGSMVGDEVIFEKTANNHAGG